MKAIGLEQMEGVGILTFNRPEVYNAVNYAMMEEMEQAITDWKNDDSIKVLMVIGAGDRAFVSGGDVKQFHSLKTQEEAHHMLGRMGKVLDSIESFGKPTIAAINGLALGGGCEIALACDIRVASEEAKLGFIQIHLGITTGWGGGTRLLSTVSRSQALYWLLSGQKFTAHQGYEAGLLQKIMPHQHFRQAAFKYASEFARAPLSVLKAYVEMANRLRDPSICQQSKAAEILKCSELWAEDAHHEAVTRFIGT